MSYPAGSLPHSDVWAIFAWLDARLEMALGATSLKSSASRSTTALPGLHVSLEEAHSLMQHPLGGDPWNLPPPDYDALQTWIEESPLSSLAGTHRLTLFDLAALVAALAPEFDRRYERLYGFLQDDITARRPSIDLLLSLFGGAHRHSFRIRFGVDSPLVRDRLIHLDVDPHAPDATWLACRVRPDEQVVCLLLGSSSVDTRLSPFCRLITPDETAAPGTDLRRVAQLAHVFQESRNDSPSLWIYLQGPSGAGRQTFAHAVAGQSLRPVLHAEIAQIPEVSLEALLPVLWREAELWGALLYLNEYDQLSPSAQSLLRRQLRSAKSMGFVSGNSTVPPLNDMLPIRFDVPSVSHRRDCWHHSLRLSGHTLGESDLNTLADRFKLNPGQIAAACRNVGHLRVLTGSPTDQPLSSRDVFAAARAQSGHDLAGLASRIEVRCDWDDLVLPPDSLTQLHELCDRAAHRNLVLETWRFGHMQTRGRGTAALFAGPSGTGKTLAAEVIANALELDLYRIDLSRLISKWLGETEKNLDRLFTAAEGANAVLLFDEADALFGKRSEVRDSHDRYANLEVSYLLQKMEDYDGIAILATNLRHHLDEAFLRRLAFCIPFPFPDATYRRRIWSAVWPSIAPTADDVDFGWLANEYTLSGGNIRNVALAAAYLAAGSGRPVTQADFRHAARREFQKLGKTIATAPSASTQPVSSGAAG
jgi:AAA+ superfamily predicted ATPase